MFVEASDDFHQPSIKQSEMYLDVVNKLSITVEKNVTEVPNPNSSPSSSDVCTLLERWICFERWFTYINLRKLESFRKTPGKVKLLNLTKAVISCFTVNFDPMVCNCLYAEQIGKSNK